MVNMVLEVIKNELYDFVVFGCLRSHLVDIGQHLLFLVSNGKTDCNKKSRLMNLDW